MKIKPVPAPICRRILNALSASESAKAKKAERILNANMMKKETDDVDKLAYQYNLRVRGY
jgi:hypothetical protein